MVAGSGIEPLTSCFKRSKQRHHPLFITALGAESNFKKLSGFCYVHCNLKVVIKKSLINLAASSAASLLYANVDDLVIQLSSNSINGFV